MVAVVDSEPRSYATCHRGAPPRGARSRFFQVPYAFKPLSLLATVWSFDSLEGYSSQCFLVTPPSFFLFLILVGFLFWFKQGLSSWPVRYVDRAGGASGGGWGSSLGLEWMMRVRRR